MIRRIITGEYRPCLELELLKEVRLVKDAGPLNPVAIAVPTNTLGLHLSRYIARDLGGHAEIRFPTLLDLARRLGEESLSRKCLSAMPPLADLLTLRKSVEECLSGVKGSYFGLVGETTGFLRVLLGAIGDLKEGCLTPGDLERALEASGFVGPSAGKIKEILALWRTYEAKKSGAGFYDRADLMAAAASSAASSPWVAGVKRLFFYGFYDLNPLQRTLVERCAEVKDTVFFFPFIDTPAFDFARPTLEWLGRIGFEPAAEEKRAGETKIPAGIDGLRRGLFAAFSGSSEVSKRGRPESSGRTAVAGYEGVTILSAAGEESECREIVRDALRLAGLRGRSDSAGSGQGREPAGGSDTEVAALGEDRGAATDGFRLNEFGILLRDPSRYVGPLSEILQGLGIEPYVREGLPLSRTRAVRSLILLTELLESDLSRRQVMDFLTFAELNMERIRGFSGAAATDGWSVNPALWDFLSKDLGIVQGIEQWRERLSAYIHSGSGVEGRPAKRPQSRREARSQGRDEAALGDAGRSDACGEGHAGRGDGAETEAGGFTSETGPEDLSGRSERDRKAAGVLLELVEFLSSASASLRTSDAPGRLVGKLSALFCELVAPGPDRDVVLDALWELAALDSCSRSVDRPLFFWLVRRHLESAQTRLGSLRGEGPVVAGLMAARGLPFKVVVLPGLTEGLFPAAARQDPILLDGERKVLNAALAKVRLEGRLGLKSERLKEDRLLFRLAVGAASRLLLLSYPRVEPASGAERIPSEFILDAASAITGERCDLGSLDRLPFYKRVPLAGLFPDDGSFIDRNEYDLMAAARAVSGDKAALKYLESGDTFFRMALEAEKRRWNEFRLTPYDGAMESPAALRALHGFFAARGGMVSPTSIETYCDCPFLYFMRNILDIEPIEDPEDVLAIPPRDLGSLAHSILERAFGKIFSEGKGPPADWEGTLLSVAHEVLEAFRRRSPHGLALLRELDERKLIDNMVSAVAKDIEELGDFRPWKLETRYGLRESDGRAGGLELAIEDDRRLALSGKIDRVDLNRSDGTARVIDYKTGKGSKLRDNKLGGGTTLQLPLYVLGAQHMLGDEARVVGAQYYFVSGERGGERVHFTADAVKERMGDLLAILRTAMRGVEKGLFFAYPGDSCAYCEYGMACAPAQALFERKQTDPRAQEFLRMKEIE